MIYYEDISGYPESGIQDDKDSSYYDSGRSEVQWMESDNFSLNSCDDENESE